MALTRRRLLAMAAGVAARPGKLAAQAPGGAMRPRITPAICLYSRVLIQIGYLDLPMVLQGMGFDGVDLSVERGGHLPPGDADYHLMPALEAFTGAGLDVPMLTTDLTSVQDPNSEQVLGLASYIGVPFFRPGRWQFSGPQASAVQRDLIGMAQLGRATKMVMGVQNDPAGALLADINRVIRPIDPQWVGYDFDVGHAQVEGGDGGFDGPLALALPRLKMVTLRDIKKDRQPCALGEGVVDFERFFTSLALAQFAGPVSLQVDYRPADLMAAIRRDLAFVRKVITKIYGE